MNWMKLFMPALFMSFADGDGVTDEGDKTDLNNKGDKGDAGAGDEGDKGDTGDDKSGKTESWADGLDDNFKTDPTLTKFKSVNDLAKSYKELESKLGKDKIVSPKDDWGDDDWAEFYNATGRPEKAENYEFSKVEFPEGMKAQEDNTAYQAMAHKHGLSQKQADGMYADFMQGEIDKYNAAAEKNKVSREEAETELRKDWGEAFEKNAKIAEKTFLENANEGAIEKFKKEGWGNDPDMVRLFAKLGLERSEDNLGEGKPPEGVLTPAEAQKKIAEVNGNTAHPYWLKDHPEHKFAKEQMESWYKMAHPEEASDIITE